MEKTSLEEIIQKLGLPDNAELLGHVVHLPSSDEFLAASKENTMSEQRFWAKHPSLAQCLSQEDAIKEAKKYGKGACVAMLFDIDDQYLVHVNLVPEDLSAFSESGKLIV